MRISAILILFFANLFIGGTFNYKLPYKKYSVFKGDTINRIDRDGLEQGPWRKYYENDSLFYEGQYRDGKRISLTYYYRDGKLKARTQYSADGQRAYVTEFYRSGHKNAEGTFEDKKKDSTWQYFDELDHLISTENYVKGVKEGVWTTYYDDGGKVQEVTWKNDKKTGPLKEYFRNGNVKTSAVLDDGIPVGMFRIYHPNGNLWQQGKYKNGLQDSVWNVYDEKVKNKLEFKHIYKAGVLMNPTEQDSLNLYDPIIEEPVRDPSGEGK